MLTRSQYKTYIELKNKIEISNPKSIKNDDRGNSSDSDEDYFEDSDEESISNELKEEIQDIIQDIFSCSPRKKNATFRAGYKEL